MKKILSLLFVISTGLFATAQNKTNAIAPAPSVAKSTKNAVTAKEATIVSFESNLVAGKLTLTKGYQKGDEVAVEADGEGEATEVVFWEGCKWAIKMCGGKAEAG